MYKQDNSMDRNVSCICGLPFDEVNMIAAINSIYSSVKSSKPCFISTPNLNFLIESQKDKNFRESVINSDLSVVDGKPLVWLAQLLKIPIYERVAGSDLVAQLIESKGNDTIIKVFFFGGEEGVGITACEKLNITNSGLTCVGNLNPGFGTVDAMSSDNIIEQINQSDADFIIVSLGAKKGQEWIEKNRKKLKAPVISHLGAVVNFLAGTVNRAPKLLQNIGLEWLWRIKEEPSLWKRYFYDGLSFIKLLMFRVTPLYLIILLFEKNRRKNKQLIILSDTRDMTQLQLSGYWGAENIDDINQAFKKTLSSKVKNRVKIVIEQNSYINASVLAKIMLFKRYLSESNRELVIEVNSKLVSNIFKYSCCEYLLD